MCTATPYRVRGDIPWDTRGPPCWTAPHGSCHQRSESVKPGYARTLEKATDNAGGMTYGRVVEDESEHGVDQQRQREGGEERVVGDYGGEATAMDLIVTGCGPGQLIQPVMAAAGALPR